ncbi:RNA polymerase sigma-70 factor (ECF subfamily) [Salinibacterium sp. CAN_S4]|uniref:sigma-70 family RNA polymerase sigma factor n=1 Tax=Salinibacterium sp. CAN_S4 TaxID=2787727 RepID=UPI0018EF4804
MSANAVVTEIEARLLQGAATGDIAAFSELYNRMSPRILGLIVRILRDRAQSEEVAQDVFLEIWQQAARFDPARGSAVGWMLRTAHNRAVDRVRASEASTARDWRQGIRELNNSQDSTDEVVSLRLQSVKIAEAMDALPELQRQAIDLTHLQGLTQTAAAELLSVPLGTVKTRVRTGLARLRKELEAA